MIDLSFLKEYWWVGAIVLGIIILAIILKKKSKQEVKSTTQIEGHNWQPMGHTVVKDKLRLVFYDKEKGVAVHTPIYTLKQLKEIEDELV